MKERRRGNGLLRHHSHIHSNYLTLAKKGDGIVILTIANATIKSSGTASHTIIMGGACVINADFHMTFRGFRALTHKLSELLVGFFRYAKGGLQTIIVFTPLSTD